MKEIIEVIPHIFAIFICTLFLYLGYGILSKQNLQINKKNMLIIILSTFLTMLNNLHNILVLKAILNIMITFAGYKIVFKDNAKKTIVIYVINYGIIILFELFLSNIISMTKFLEISTGYLTYAKLIMSVVTSLLAYLFLRITLIKKILIKLVDIIVSLATLMNILTLLLIVIVVIGIFNVYNYETHGSYILILIIVSLFTILFTLIIKSKTHEENLKQSNKRLVDYNEKYGKFLDEYKIYKHNIKHKLAGMKAFGNKKINALIDDLLEEETSFTIKNNNIYNVPKEIKGIVAERLYNTKISVIVDNKLKEDPFKNMSPKEFNHISESIGICLDNAVEASIETENPIVTLDLYEDKEYIYIKVGNTFSNNIDIDELGDKYYSTKNRGSGLGLFSLKQNRFIQDKISIINDIYYIELKIKKHADS